MQRTVTQPTDHLQRLAEHLAAGGVSVHLYGWVMKRNTFCAHTTNRIACCTKADLDESDERKILFFGCEKKCCAVEEQHHMPRKAPATHCHIWWRIHDAVGLWRYFRDCGALLKMKVR